MTILLRQRRAIQSAAPPIIDWSNPLTRGLVFCWVASHQAELVRRRTSTYTGTRPTYEINTQGAASRFNANGRISFGRDSAIEPAQELSLLAVTRPVDNASAFSNYIISKAASSVTSYGLLIGTSSSTLIDFIVVDSLGNDVGPANFVGPSYPYERPVVLAGSVKSGSSGIFVNGVKRGSGSLTYTSLRVDTSAPLVIGDYSTSVAPFNGSVSLFCLWNRAISDAENIALGNNPWQIFLPPQRTLYVPGLDGTIARPFSDVTVTGWSASAGTDLYQTIDEATASDTDYIISPDIASTPGAFVAGITPLDAGNYNIRFRARYTQSSGQARVSLLDDAGTSQGTSSWVTLSAAFTDYTASVTTTGTATRVRIEVQP